MFPHTVKFLSSLTQTKKVLFVILALYTNLLTSSVLGKTKYFVDIKLTKHQDEYQ